MRIGHLLFRGGDHVVNLKTLIPVWCVTLLASLFYRNSTLEMNKEIGIIFRFFPHQYTIPSLRIRKLYNLPKKEMHKYYVARLYFPIVHFLLATVVSIVSLCFNVLWISNRFVIFQVLWILIDTIVFLVYSSILKKHK